MTNARGIDGSSNQAVYTAAGLRQYSFAFFRASDGTTGTDPNFAANWAAGKAAGIHRGAYHELTNLSPVSTQAAHFIGVVKAQGVLPGDMMAVVASDYPGLTGAAVLEFARAVSGAFPDGPVLVYSDLSALPGLGECTGYPLWVAEYGVPVPGSVTPWGDWVFWQGSGTGQDTDVYNGTPGELQEWLGMYAPAPVPGPGWVFSGVRWLSVVSAGPASVRLSWSAPGVPEPEAVDHYQVTIRDGGEDVASYPRDVAKGSNPQEWQGGSLQPGTQYEALVRAVAAVGGHASPWSAVTFTTPAA